MPTFSNNCIALAWASVLEWPSTCTGASMIFSTIVIWLQRLKLWNTIPSLVRIRSTCFWSAATRLPLLSVFISINSPLTRTSPLLGVSNKLIQRKKVLFPEPLAPIKEITSPLFACKDIPLMTSFSLKLLCKSVIDRARVMFCSNSEKGC